MGRPIRDDSPEYDLHTRGAPSIPLTEVEKLRRDLSTVIGAFHDIERHAMALCPDADSVMDALEKLHERQDPGDTQRITYLSFELRRLAGLFPGEGEIRHRVQAYKEEHERVKALAIELGTVLWEYNPSTPREVRLIEKAKELIQKGEGVNG